VHRAILDGQRETGVTIMQVVPALDAGDMLARVARPIGPDETSVDVERDLSVMGARLLLEVIEQFEAGTVRPEPQDDARSTYAPRLRKEDGLIDWSQPARTVHDRVRGLHPWPHAYAYLDDARVIVLETRVIDEAGTGGAAPSPPGEILQTSRDGIVVATGNGGALAIESLQPEGRRSMTAREFLAGRPLRPGARFAPPKPDLV
jgi:methionyl-tRNA formyltransferase